MASISIPALLAFNILPNKDAPNIWRKFKGQCMHFKEMTATA
jgi:hypothetical protein